MMEPGDPKYRYLYAVWAFLESLCFGGLIYGWSSLAYVLKQEGLYSNLCDESESTSSVPTQVTVNGNVNAR